MFMAHQPETAARVDEILNRRPTVGLAVGVVRDGTLEFFNGHGLADIASGTPVTEDTGFRIASITKTVTAIAVTQLWERGLVDFDAPAGDYLRAYRLIPAKPGFRPVTVRHLLTHTSGIPEVLHPSDLLKPLFGETVKAGQPVPSLAEYYQGRLRIQAEPGTRFIYTDHNFATLGQIVEDVSGQPLGMADTDLVRTARIQSRLATEVHPGRGAPRRSPTTRCCLPGPRPCTPLPGIWPATSRRSSDTAPTSTVACSSPRRWPACSKPTSQIFVAPDDGLAVMAFTNGARQAMLWLPGELAGLLNHLLGILDEAIRIDVPQHPEIWADLCGRYRLPARLTDARARQMLGAGVEVFTRRGRLMLRVLSPIPAVYRGFPLHPDDRDDPYVFRIDLTRFGIGTARVIFSPATGALHLDLMPLTLHRRPTTSR